MKTKLLLGFVLILTLSLIPGKAFQKEASSFTLTINRTGVTAKEADANLLFALGSYAKSLPGDADIYTRNSDGSIQLDISGNPVFDLKKVQARIAASFEQSVDQAEIQANAQSRIQLATQAILIEEQTKVKDRKPDPVKVERQDTSVPRIIKRVPRVKR